jgi:ABC-2 type transport system permease protein
MSNILAIAQKELRSYFASPIGYVITGLFALLFGWIFYAYLSYFVRSSEQMMMGGGTPNVNQHMISGLLQTTATIILFVMPMITIRTYSVQIILGKFFGAMGLYAAMLAVTVLYVSILFFLGNPEWKPVLAGYLGLLLMGGCFIAVGLLVSSLTKNQIVAGIATFAVFLFLWVINWIGESAGPTAREIVTYLSIPEHFSDFARGVIDTKHVVYYVSFITFGLFLTAKSVDSERWRG